MKTPNELIYATSPYLLQHAYNPVQWHAWSEKALQKARDENKLLIISIGYSACHWCHVMEHESFEDEEIATVMNKSFVCIKIDREERPDIDQVYMDAVQMMTGRGGWPLNVIALPDQRPIYGGTYFPKEQWRQVLLQLAAFFRNDPAKCDEYANELIEGMKKMSTLQLSVDDADRSFPNHAELVSRWSKQWDHEEGGPLRAPKFPLPDGYRYLLATTFAEKNESTSSHVHLTLTKMACGGIYDQLGGGFARYSTDMVWKVPHFEKMLYDNALLVSLYADGFKESKNSLYKDVLVRTLAFVERELMSEQGAFYSALDADTEGVEGKFYCWTIDEVNQLLLEDAPLAIDYFSLNEKGYWEHDLYIPLRPESLSEILEKYSLEEDELAVKIESIRVKMFDARSKRIAPGLDDKILCSWNALMLSGYLDAYNALGDPHYLEVAKKCAGFIEKNFLKDLHLFHAAKIKGNEVLVTIPGFLEDYAFVMEAFLSLFSCTMEINYLSLVDDLAQTVLKEFSSDTSPIFWFTSSHSESLIARKQEVQDNVIPSSNAVMSHNLLRLSRINGDSSLENRCRNMLQVMKPDVEKGTAWYSRWARVFLELERGTELAITGPKCKIALQSILNEYLPLTIIAGTQVDSTISIFNSRFDKEATQFFVCREKSCHPPVMEKNKAMEYLLK
ncbi:MAG: thioredoxin domain-containing protein [Bacteroidia bacterium]